MTIRRIDPDEAITINGVQVTGRQLAEARQELSHRGVHNPRWTELSQHDQDTAAISAGSWLRALVELAPGPDAPTYCVDGTCGRTAHGQHVPHPLVPLADENHWNDVECEQRPHCTIPAHHSIDGGEPDAVATAPAAHPVHGGNSPQPTYLVDHRGECPWPDDSCRSLPTCPDDDQPSTVNAPSLSSEVRDA